MSFTPILQQLREMGHAFFGMIPGIIIGMIILTLMFYLARGIRLLVEHVAQKRKRARNLSLALGRLTQGGVILLGLFVAMLVVFPSFKVVDLIQLLGISSVAIGFAFRDILQNFLAGILLLLNEPFRIGDQIIASPFEGTVEDIQTRATTIRTYDGRRIVIPNSTLFTQAVTVNTAFDHRRLEYDIGLMSNTDMQQAKMLILTAIHALDGVLREPAPDALVVGIEDNRLVIRVRWWIHPPRRIDALDTQDAVLSSIQRVFAEHGIKSPLPEILVHEEVATKPSKDGQA